MRVAALITLCAFIVAPGCLGEQVVESPESSQYGDEDLSCTAISKQLRKNQDDMRAIVKMETEAHQSNIIMGIVGALLFFPTLFFIDATEDEVQELRDYEERNDTLRAIHRDKGCGNDVPAKYDWASEVESNYV